MKIYSKRDFVLGLICSGALILFAFDVIQADWWQWLISIAITARFLYAGLTEMGSRRAQNMKINYKAAATALHGKHHSLKTNLPLVLTGTFLAGACLFRFVSGEPLPIWICVVFVLGLLVSVFYSIGVEQSITDYIDDNIPDNEQECS